jgi:predicted DNA-binding protein with PD1-like motif
MRSKLIKDGEQRTYAVILDTGDEAIATLARFANEEKLSAAQITAIGAFSDAVLGYFDWERKEYCRNPVEEQVEVVSMVGDVALDEKGASALHVHAVLGRRDAMALGGHLLAAHVRPTLEAIVTESPRHLRKRKDAESGLALIRID